MKRFLFSLAGVALIGCASFSTNVFRTEQTAVNTAYTAYVGYTNAVNQGLLKVSADESNAIKSARLKFAASVSVVEAWRSAYETNNAVKPQLQAALDAALGESSNIVWLVNYLKK